MGQVSKFLGIEFTWKWHMDGHLSPTLTQQSFVETLIESLSFDLASVSTFTTPYRSGLPIGLVPHQNMSSVDRDTLRLQYQSLMGSLNWLAHTTRPDLSTVVFLLAQHQSNPVVWNLLATLFDIWLIPKHSNPFYGGCKLGPSRCF
jgi:hypothetical protein